MILCFFALTNNSLLRSDQMPLPQLMTSSNDSDSFRSRAESVKDKTKIINEQLNEVILMRLFFI